MKYPISVLLFAVILSCNNKQSADAVSNKELPHQLVKKLTDIIVVDIFTPPVASRIYANTSLAMYEALRFENSSAPSITAKLKGFDAMPVPLEKVSYNYSIAAWCHFLILKHYMPFVFGNKRIVVPKQGNINLLLVQAL